MKAATYKTTDKNEILEKIFSFLVQSGLENISIRELTRGTGLKQGNLYYWFEDKTTIICEAAEYGLRKVTDEIFQYVFKSINDLKYFFDTCLDEICKYQKELRYIYQMAASPVYGEKLRKDGKYLKIMYDKYAKKLAEHLKCDEEKIKPVVYLFVAAVLDYAVWGDKENAQTEINFIYSMLPHITNEN